VLALVYMVGRAAVNPVLSAMLFGFFLTIDLAFFAANMPEDRAGPAGFRCSSRRSSTL